ncbi:hypothetical protein E2562_016621 [Oryza meyeriana var. granulata]|uniref:Uncharacterized protein n=1 Tax=Oryza meyeriana var. granulata TaxID=110450 RepID=A0A6G1ELN8_9ORYZ|nr:hypothetical protein E2562_016621 [Oryza meyeriana var. granulata]
MLTASEGVTGPILEDVIHHNEAFHFPTAQEHLHVFTLPGFQVDGDGNLDTAPMEIHRFSRDGCNTAITTDTPLFATWSSPAGIS